MKKSKSTILGINANIITAVAYIGGLILMWIPTICYFGMDNSFFNIFNRN